MIFWLLLLAHAVGVAAASVVGRSQLRRGALVAAIAPAITTVYVLAWLLSDNGDMTATFTWVAGLDLAITMRLTALSALMTLLVSGIGTLVFIYAAGYFGPEARGGRFPASLLAFSTAMLGLVWADSVWTLFIFWEFTSITSFLLVGYKNTDSSVQTAARRALLITGGGGLVLLAGLLVLAAEAGTTVLGELGSIESTPAASLAAILIMVGAATKSAQVPFHVWLPGAMAAPTPVSAYLHSATMVKAGVLLVALTGTAFSDVAVWTVLGSVFGIASMIWGAVGALRHRDAKLILAWGTVSQLGLLVTLLAQGTAKATFAAVSLLFAHAIFKAALFLVVGEIDIRTGTRQIGELGGLARSMPIAFGVALISGLSMAGAPPLLGFTAKEAAIEAALGLEGPGGGVVAAAIIGGSVLTVAYTVRFLITVFGPGPQTAVAPRRMAMTLPAALLGLASVLGYIFIGIVNDLVVPAATQLDAKADVYLLIAWPGLKTAFLISVAVLIIGGVLGRLAAAASTPVPEPIGANNADSLIDGLLDRAPRITAVVQHGSLPVYLATMGLVVLVAATPFLFGLESNGLDFWDGPIQGVLALAIVGCSIAGTRVGSRLGAALILGAVGVAMSGIFLVHGAPDLALTQLLVETIVVVGFVLGLGHLAHEFPQVDHTWRAVRVVLAVGIGLVVPLALVAASANPTGQAPIEAIAEGSAEIGGGNNTVNVILTDLRALDTLGEVVVLATVAAGILALASSRRGDATS